MSHRKRLEDQLSAGKNKGSINQAFDVDVNHLHENLDLNDRSDAQLDRLVNDLGQVRVSAKKGHFDADDEEDEKYKGKKVSRSELFGNNSSRRNKKDKDLIEEEDEEEEEGMEDDDDDEEPEHDVKKSSKNKKASQKKTNTSEKIDTKNLGDVNIDDILEDLNKQDEEVFKDVQKDTKEIEKAMAVKNQEKLWEGLLEGRVSMQNAFKLANQLPKTQVFEHYRKDAPQVSDLIAGIQVELVDLIDLMNDISGESGNKSAMAKNSSSTTWSSSRSRVKEAQKYLNKLKINRNAFVQDYEFDAEAIWNDLDTHFLSNHSRLEDTINTFSQRFNLMSTNTLKGKFANIFQTPVQQAQKVMDDYPRLLHRTQLRDKDSKRLGAINDDKDSEFDKEIYNDTDFYSQLYKELMISSAAQTKQDETGLLVGNTQAYLKERLLRARVAKPDVDRRASKARKLRYEVHAKLMNFMTPQDNLSLIPGRDELIKNMFGMRNKNQDDTVQKQAEQSKATKASSLKKKTKKNQIKNGNQDEEAQEEEIQLF